MIDPLYALCLLAVALFVLPNAITITFKQKHLLVPAWGVGKSMEPAISGGLTVTLMHYPLSVEEGDVVIYEVAGEKICHRVVEVDGDRIRIRGDNNDWDDGWFEKDDVSAKMLGGDTPLYLPLSPYAVRQTVRRFR